MREIKFRSYDTIEQAYCPFITDHLNRDLYPHIDVQQWTGLLSKNGVEIYEGDIVRLTDDWDNESVHQVEYCAEYGYPAFDVKPHIDCESNGLSHFMATGEIEVIGNIYEHSHLLEANQ